MYLPAFGEYNLLRLSLCSYSPVWYESFGESSKERPCAVVTIPLKHQACCAALPCPWSGIEPARRQRTGAGNLRDVKHSKALGPSFSPLLGCSAAFPGQGKDGLWLLPAGKLDPGSHRLHSRVMDVPAKTDQQLLDTPATKGGSGP